MCQEHGILSQRLAKDIPSPHPQGQGEIREVSSFPAPPRAPPPSNLQGFWLWGTLAVAQGSEQRHPGSSQKHKVPQGLLAFI